MLSPGPANKNTYNIESRYARSYCNFITMCSQLQNKPKFVIRCVFLFKQVSGTHPEHAPVA